MYCHNTVCIKTKYFLCVLVVVLKIKHAKNDDYTLIHCSNVLYFVKTRSERLTGKPIAETIQHLRMNILYELM